MELTKLQKHDESKVTVFIFHSLAFLKFVWCNLNNKIFLKCFSFTAANFLSHSLYVFVNWSSILTFQYCLFDQLSDEAGEERSADNIILITVSATPDWRCLITPSCTPSDWAAILCPLRPQTQTGCSRCLKQSWEII